MRFQLAPDATPGDDPIALEQDLLDRASQPMARLWQSGTALVVPRSYRKFTGFDAACAQFAAQGCPVWVRASGGGLVPLDPGVLNVSLAYPMTSQAGSAVERIYRHLCQLLAGTLQPLGVNAHWQAVSGSFCDGRFNLAVGDGEQARKIAGTAQYWRLQQGQAAASGRYRVLAHALLLVAPDLDALHQRANAFEALLGSGRSYTREKTSSVAELCPGRAADELMATVRQALQERIAREQPPASA